MENKIVFSGKITNNKNKILVIKNDSKLKPFINKFINLDNKYNKLLKEIETRIKNKTSKQIDLTILDNKNQGINIKIFVLFNEKNESENKYDKYRNIGLDIHKYSIINGISNFDLVNTLDTMENYCLLDGILMSNYNFSKYKTKYSLDTEDKKILKYEIVLVNNEKLDKKKIGNLTQIINSVYLARDLTNEPPNKLDPNTFPKIIKGIIAKHKLPIKFSVFGPGQLKKMNMNLLLGVGKKQNKSVCNLVVLEYAGKSKKVPTVLLGKGVTFDTGGINLKRKGESLLEGKSDMAGASAIISFIFGYSKLGGKDSIVAVIPIVENNLDSSTLKPGDVLTSRKGITVEIVDTDSEGRLIMADSLSYIVDKYPNSAIIDFATLTGQQEELSCKQFSVIMGNNNETIKKKLIESGIIVNEELVEIPLLNKFESKIKSDVADIKNSSISCSADMIIAGIFLRKFINKNTNWTHIDIAGTSYYMKEVNEIHGGESSGIGVRMLFEFFG